MLKLYKVITIKILEFQIRIKLITNILIQMETTLIDKIYDKRLNVSLQMVSIPFSSSNVADFPV